MITIIHGDDIVASRKYLQEQKENIKEFVALEAEAALSDFAQNIEGSALFNDTKTIFIENFLSKAGKLDVNAKEIIAFVSKHEEDAKLFFWERKEISKRTLSLFKNALVKTFKIPQAIFLFLDSLKPNIGVRAIDLFHQALQASEPEILLFMLVRQFRFLIAVSSKAKTPIEELSRLAPWQEGKLKKQASYFSKEQLKSIYQKLYYIDLAQKTGSSSLSLIQSIDFFLLGI
ncbi:MAG: hypothetical protein Q7R31_03505 [Candidatus Levybacteria bacterium]|nr:hypothetical protein [Candidatus Levybacteria bacterium]